MTFRNSAFDALFVSLAPLVYSIVGGDKKVVDTQTETRLAVLTVLVYRRNVTADMENVTSATSMLI